MIHTIGFIGISTASVGIKKVQTVVIDNPTNINKASHHLSPQVIEHENDKA
jgi:hypothetical protein